MTILALFILAIVIGFVLAMNHASNHCHGLHGNGWLKEKRFFAVPKTDTDYDNESILSGQ